LETLKILIAYFSDTGNTATVAQAIFGEVESQDHELHLREIIQISPENLNTLSLWVSLS
jgi:flavodoxin